MLSIRLLVANNADAVWDVDGLTMAMLWSTRLPSTFLGVLQLDEMGFVSLIEKRTKRANQRGQLLVGQWKIGKCI